MGVGGENVGSSDSGIPGGYVIIKEGEAEILMHPNNQVFYNKTQVNNRDISIAVLRTFISKRKEEYAAMINRKNKVVNDPIEPVAETSDFDPDVKVNGECNMNSETAASKPDDKSDVPKSCRVQRELKPPRILEALAASGLRAIRYAREVEGVGQVIAVDNDKASVEACRRNLKFNGSLVSSKVESHLADSQVYMLTHQKEFDVIDIDPYGTPSLFLDSAVQSIADGGLLMCTATDLAVLCGGNAEVCYSKYDSYPTKGKYCHEMALRILLATIESHANRHKRYIVPVLSVHMDFYIRVFVRIFTSAIELKNTPLKLSYIYQCVGCDSFHLQSVGRTVVKNTSVKFVPGFGPVVPQECVECGKKFNMGGPIWSAPIHDQEWVTSMLTNVKSMKNHYPAYDKISAVLTLVLEELPDVPLFVSLHNLCSTLKCTSPSAVMFRSAVLNAGFRISGSHVTPLAIKTDAPMEVIWDIMRCWVKNHPIKAHASDQSGTSILAKEPKIEANFSRAAGSLSKAQAKKVARFLPNPERHWGPKLRAGRQITSKHASLLGQDKIDKINNGTVSHEDDGQPDPKRLKVEQSELQ